MKRFTFLEPLALALLFIGALNWGLLGITGGETNALAEIFGTGTLTDAIYVAIGIAALVMIPRLMDTLHLSDGAHPRGV